MRNHLLTRFCVTAGLALLPLAIGCGPNLAEQFERAKTEGTVAALEQFESANPDNPYKDEIAELKDDVRFKEAQSEGTSDALQTYLADFPEGKHQAEAKGELDDLAFKAAEKKGDAEAFKAYLEKNPKGKHVKEARVQAGTLRIAELEKEGTSDQLAAFLKEPGIPIEVRGAGYVALDRKVKAETGDAGLIRFPVTRNKKMTGYSWIAGYTGGKVFELDGSKFKMPASLEWKTKGKGKKMTFKGPELKGTLEAKLIGEVPSEPVTLVALLKVAGRSYLATQEIKLQPKALAKKKSGQIKAKLAWPDAPGQAGTAKLHLMLVQGAVPAKVVDLKPISTILVYNAKVVVPAEAIAAAKEKMAQEPAAAEEPAEEKSEVSKPATEKKEAATEDKEETKAAPATEDKEDSKAEPATEDKEETKGDE